MTFYKKTVKQRFCLTWRMHRASFGVLLTITMPGLFWSSAVCHLMKKKKNLHFFTVKKQNIVREYVCCECSTTKGPFMCRIGVFLLRTVTQLRSTVDSVFILNTCSTAEHQPAAATNLKQLPHQKRHSSSTAASIKTGQRQKGTG